MQSSRPRPLYLGFSSQKGGVGKSTLAEILSSMLYYEEGISLFVVDCDLTQDSFFKLREREKGTIGEDPALTAYMQTYFHQLERRSYRIIKARPEEAVARAEALAMQYPEEGYQLVVFDFPGHAGTRELLELSLEMDYILSPLEPDIQSMVACLSYAKSIQDLGISMQTARIKDIWLLWNKVDRRVRAEGGERMVFVLEQFTLSEDKQLEVRLYERGGGRTLAFYLDEEDLLLARKIDKLQLKW